MRPQNPASADEITLYCSMGEAVWKTQIAEQALSHTVTLKRNSAASREEADVELNKMLRYTFGKAIVIAAKEKLFAMPLQQALDAFLVQRNWLVHKAMPESLADFHTAAGKEKLFQKIKAVATAAENLHRSIELDLISFCELKGQDMSAARAVMNA